MMTHDPHDCEVRPSERNEGFQYEELRNISFIRDKFVETAEIFDFNQIEPSTLELLSTLEAKSGPSIIQETYSFTDKGRDIALRFDLTIGLSRFVSMRRDLKLPAKLSSFGGVWRYDEPQHGRYRYFHQWDVEIFGSSDVDADAEVIDFVSSFLSKLNIDFVILINHRSILEEYLSKYLGITDNSVISEMMRAIGKLSKKVQNKSLMSMRKGSTLSNCKNLSNLFPLPIDQIKY